MDARGASRRRPALPADGQHAEWHALLLQEEDQAQFCVLGHTRTTEGAARA